jgi:uncharacterized protein YbaP (TraB family)
MWSWSDLKKRGSRALAALGAFSVAACTTAAAPAEVAGGQPALWKVADEDTTIYLFGTIHLLPEGTEWRSPKLERAIASSDALVLEVVLGGDPMKSAQAMMQMGMSKGLPPLAERLPAEKRPALASLIKSTGVPAPLLDQMETWAAALTLLTLSFQQMGLKAELGVERGLEESYRAGKKPVSGLETMEQQLGFFDTLSEESQRLFLAGVVESPTDVRAEFEGMLKAWKAGDTEAIAKTFDNELALSPELREVLMKRRNAAWAEWVRKRLDQPGTVMVAVGAGHLAGEDSVQEMLAAKGLKATRVQ